MAYAEKYYFTFKGLSDDNSYEVEILERNYTGATTELRGDANPFNLMYPEFEPFQPVRGGGSVINLLSETPMQHHALYTNDWTLYQVQLKKNGFIHWCGYWDSELYNEPFAKYDNYPVQFTANDGLALLSRMNYVNADGDNYTGITTQWQVITYIMSKLELLYWGICVNISTTSPDITIGAEETLFHKVYVANENFYDEDGVAFNCRKVLDEILRPYGAFLTISNNKVLITDINVILDTTGTTTFKIYYPTSFTYAGITNINLNLGDVSTIGFTDSEQSLDVKSAVNKQMVSYSPYWLIDIFKFNAKDDFSDKTSIVNTFGDTDYQWEEHYYNTSELWSKHNNGVFASYLGIDGQNINEEDYYLKITPYTHTGTTIDNSVKSFVYKAKLPFMLGSENYKLRIQMKGYLRTIADLNGETPEYSLDKSPRSIELYCRLQIGDKKFYYDGAYWKFEPLAAKLNSGWVALADAKECALSFNEMFGGVVSTTPPANAFQPVNDQWIDLTVNRIWFNSPLEDDNKVDRVFFDVPLQPDMNGGQLEFSIYHFHPINYYLDIMDTADFNDFRIKDIIFSIVDADGNEISNFDREYIGLLDERWKNEGEEVRCYLGTNIDQYPIERGNLLLYNVDKYEPITQFERYGFTGTTEELLLRSVVSNYENPQLQVNFQINRIDNIIGNLTYENWLAGKKFLPISASHNYAEETTSITMREITADNLSVYLNY